MKLTLWTYLFLLFSPSFFGQRGSVHISQRQFLIGEHVTLEYVLQSTEPLKVEYNPYAKIIPLGRTNNNGSILVGKDTELEITTTFKDTLLSLGNSFEWIGVYEVTIWDSGYFQVPAHSIRINGESFEFPACNFRSDLVESKKGKTIYDIREVFTPLPIEPPVYLQWLKKYWWLLLLIFLLIFLVIRRKRILKKATSITPQKPYSLKDKTLLAITALNDQKLWEQDKLKEHYIELSYILRAYLGSRFELQLLEKTTQETMLLLRQRKVDATLIKLILELLSEADLVKFAKSTPAPILILSKSDLAKEIVIQTSPIEFDYEQQ